MIVISTVLPRGVWFHGKPRMRVEDWWGGIRHACMGVRKIYTGRSSVHRDSSASTKPDTALSGSIVRA